MNEAVSQVFFNSPFSILFIFWALVWKGVALWKAATKRQLIWFAILLVFNSFGILEILYIFWLNRISLDKENRLLEWLDKRIGKRIKTS